MHSTFISSSFSKRFLALVAGLSLALYTVPLAFAASVYQVAPSTGTVGTSIPQIELEYTVDTTAQTWANADTLNINLPPNIGPTGWAGVSYTVEFDEDVTNDAVGETAITAGGGNGQYSGSGPDLIIKWDQTTWVADNTDTIRVLIATNTPVFQNSSTNFTFSGTTAAGGDTNPSGVASMNISAGDPNASVVLASPTVGATGNTALFFTPLVGIDPADEIIFTFPSYMNVASAAFASTTLVTASGSPSISCGVASQVVTCTVGGTGGYTAAAGSIVLTGITSYNVGTTDITAFEVEDEGTDANSISLDTTVALTDITAADAAGSASLGDNYRVGVEGNTTLSFTIATNLDADDTVEVTFPSFLDVSGVSFSSETFSGAGTFSGCSASGQVVTCTANGSITAGTGSIVLAGILALEVDSTDITSLEVENEGVAADDISTDSSVSLTDSINTSGGGVYTGGHGGSSSGSSDDDEDEEQDEMENPFSDLSSSDDYYEEILELYELGIIDGYSDGTVQEDEGMNRAELMKIVVLAVTDEPDEDTYSNCYSDVTTQWFAPYVCYATEQGWIEGYPDGMFHPEYTANNAEILKMILNTNGYIVGEAQDGEAWYQPYIDEAVFYELIDEEDFEAGAVATRGYAFHILSLLLNL